MNYKNILKLKINLNKKQYFSINHLTEINSNLLQLKNFLLMKSILIKVIKQII